MIISKSISEAFKVRSAPVTELDGEQCCGPGEVSYEFLVEDVPLGLCNPYPDHVQLHLVSLF